MVVAYIFIYIYIILLCPAPKGKGALSDDARLTSVAYIRPKSRTERPKKNKIGIEVPTLHVTLIPLSRSKGQGHPAALVGCSSHYIMYTDETSFYATAQSGAQGENAES